MKTIVFVLLAVFFQSTVAQKTVFNHPFAPQEGLTSSERPIKLVIGSLVMVKHRPLLIYLPLLVIMVA